MSTVGRMRAWSLCCGGFTALGGRAALACPDCIAGKVARAQVWDQHFSFNLLVALLPFLIIGVVCVWVDLRSKPARISRKRRGP